MTRRFNKRFARRNAPRRGKGKGFFGNKVSRREARLSTKFQAPPGFTGSRFNAGNPEADEEPPRN